MSKATISIICPVYNSESFLNECILSVVGQSDGDWELILINDGSTDTSREICEKFSKSDKRIKLIDKKNGGQMQARFDGIRNASGEYIMFLDSDDLLDKKAVETIRINIGSNNVDAILFNAKIHTNEEVKKLPFVKERKILHESDIISKYLFGQQLFGYLWMFCFKKEMLMSVINHEANFKNIRYTEDVHFISKCLPYLQRLLLIDNMLYFYRLNEHSITHSLTDKDRYDRFLVFNDIYLNLYNRNNKFELSKIVAEHISWSMISYLEHINDRCRFKKEFKKIRQSFLNKVILRKVKKPSKSLKLYRLFLILNLKNLFFIYSHKQK